MTSHPPISTLSLAASTLLAASALAQSGRPADPGGAFASATPGQETRWQAGLNSGYVGGGTAEFQGTDAGKSDAFHLGLDAGVRLALNPDWSLRLGLASENFFLDQPGGVPVPDEIHTLRLNTGLGYRINDQWTVTGLLSPSLYRWEDVGGDTFGLAGGVLATFEQNPALTWTMGVLVAPDNDLKVLPVAGVRWRINDHYTLDVGMPKTRLTYRVNSQWTVYGGLDVSGGTFRTSKTLGAEIGLPRYNNALATYRDLRLGVGTGYEIASGLRVEVEAGYSVFREIDYPRIDENVRFDPAPQVRLGLVYRF